MRSIRGQGRTVQHSVALLPKYLPSLHHISILVLLLLLLYLRLPLHMPCSHPTYKVCASPVIGVTWCCNALWRVTTDVRKFATFFLKNLIFMTGDWTQGRNSTVNPTQKKTKKNTRMDTLLISLDRRSPWKIDLIEKSLVMKNLRQKMTAMEESLTQFRWYCKREKWLGQPPCLI